MKNSLIYSFLTLALAAGLAASCTKESLEGAGGEAPEQLTASIAQVAIAVEETKTSTGAFDATTHQAVITWSANDEVTVTDAAGKTSVYKINDANAGETVAKFSRVSSLTQSGFGSAPFTATYGSKPSSYPTIAPGATVPNGLYMEASSTALSAMKFEVACGLMKLTLTSSAQKTVTKITISGAGSYTVTPSGGSAAVTSTGTIFLIPVMPGRYSEIRVFDDGTPSKSTVFKSGVTISAGHLQPVTAALTTEAAVAHEYVNIGGQTWATMNIGATTVAGDLNTCAGDFYAWGSTNKIYESLTWTYPDTPNSNGLILPQPTIVWKTGYETGFSPANAPFYVSGDTNANTTFSKYYGDDALTQLLPEDDIATQTWGNDWRMPTSQDFETLYESCGAPKDTLGKFV